VKCLAIVLVVCVAWIAGTASAALSGWVKLFEIPGNGIYRFTDSGPDLTVNCYVMRDDEFKGTGGGISCVRIK
jgi:hypothetical protein